MARKRRRPTKKTRRLISEARKGQHTSPKTEFKKGHTTWNKGMKYSKQMISRLDLRGLEKGREKWNEERKLHFNSWNKGKPFSVGEENPMYGKRHSAEARKKMSETKKRRFRTGETVYHNPMLGKHHTEETKRKIRESTTRLWRDTEYREKCIEASLKQMFRRPTSLERATMNDVVIPHNLPLAYCGDGSLFIGYKNPDFYETNGKKFCVEVANKYHHPSPWEENRVKHFAKFGWNCLIIFEDELDDKERLVEKIRSFLGD